MIVALLKMTRQPTKHLLKKYAGVPSTKPWDLDPMVLDAPGKGGDPGGSGGLDQRQGKARQRRVGIGWECPKTVAGKGEP